MRMLSRKGQVSSVIVLMATAFLSSCSFVSAEQPQEMREGGLPPVLDEVPSPVPSTTVAAVERTPKLAAAARETLGSLEAANPSTRDNVPGLWYSIGKDGFVREVHGKDLAPDCPVAGENIEELVRCYGEKYQGIYMKRDHHASLDLDHLKLEQSGKGQFPGETTATLQIYHDGVPIEQGRLRVNVINGRLSHLIGQLVDTSVLPARSSLPANQLIKIAGNALGAPVRSMGTTFDLETGRFVFRARGERSGKPTDALVDETTGELLRTESAYAPSNTAVSVNRNVSAYDYPELPEAFLPGRWSVWSLPVSCTGRFVFGPACTGDPCRYQLRQLGAVDVPVVLMPDGSPWVVQSPCASSPFTSAMSTPEGQRQDIYRMLSKLREMKVHWSTYLPAGNWSQLYLQIGPQGNSIDTGSKISINVPTFVTAAHEYGHYVQLGYSQFAGHPNVKEGWADTFFMYYALYSKYVTQEWPNGSYFMPSAADNRYHTQELVDGAYFPHPKPTGVSFDEMVWPRTAGCLLADPDSVNTDIKYACGWLMSVVYWELAWNQCRTSFKTCLENQNIVTSGIYANSPWMLANAAFAYAISNTGGVENLDTFMDRVSNRYGDFCAAGYLDPASYGRVLSVMAHHRFGAWKDYSAYVLPGTRLPRKDLITHPNFHEAENGLFVNPGSILLQTAVNRVSNDRYVYVTGRTSASGYSGELVFNVNVPLYLDGSYNFRIKYLAATAGCNSTSSETYVDYKVDGVQHLSTQLVPASCSWQWQSTPVFPLPFGRHTVSLLPYYGPGSYGAINLDAVVIEKMCVGNQPCQLY